jgi:uncharacterized membrane protein YhfC
MNWVNYGFVLLISVIAPLGLTFFLMIKQKDGLKPFFFGVLSFTFSQILLRLPLLQGVLSSQVWFIAFSYAYPWVFLFLISFSAGLFEEYGRFVLMKWFLKKLTLKQVLFFGLGHGGIEAFLLVGLPVVLNAHLFMDVNALYAGMERISAVVIHCALSVLVYRSIKSRKHLLTWWAIVIHTAFNFFALGLMRLGSSIWMVELFLFVFAVGFMWFILKEDKKYDQTMDNT